MAPVCDSMCRCPDAAESCSSNLGVPSTDNSISDPEPFYGMFDSHDVETEWSCQGSPSPGSAFQSSIPEASETFQRVMQLLDDVKENGQLRRSSYSVPKPKEKQFPSSSGLKNGEHKSSQLVKKSASFSASDLRPTMSSLSVKDRVSRSGSAKRRLSAPCMPNGKHVQWADEAGVSNLVSVRLIKPRLAKCDKTDGQITAPTRSILRRLSGLH